MAKRISKEDLLQSQHDAQERATRLAWFVQSLAPAAGFSFLASPRGLQALLVYVCEGGSVSFYDVTSRTAAVQTLEADLWRMHQDGPHLDSLSEALSAASKYRAKFKAA